MHFSRGDLSIGHTMLPTQNTPRRTGHDQRAMIRPDKAGRPTDCAGPGPVDRQTSLRLAGRYRWLGRETPRRFGTRSGFGRTDWAVSTGRCGTGWAARFSSQAARFSSRAGPFSSRPGSFSSRADSRSCRTGSWWCPGDGPWLREDSSPRQNDGPKHGEISLSRRERSRARRKLCLWPFQIQGAGSAL